MTSTHANLIARRLRNAGYDWTRAVAIARDTHGVNLNDFQTAAEALDLRFAGQPKQRANANAKARARAVKEIG